MMMINSLDYLLYSAPVMQTYKAGMLFRGNPQEIPSSAEIVEGLGPRMARESS
jgi:hypothetical protein